MKKKPLVTALACIFAAPAFAQQTSPPDVTRLREVSISATRTESPVEELPVTVRTLTAEQIEKGLATDVKDLIRYEPGVSVRAQPSRITAAGASTGRGGNEGFIIRGLEGNQVLIQVDGIRLPNSYSFGPNNFGRGDYIDLEAMKSVEILRGPASTLYGSDGLAGAVTFVTKDPADYLSLLGKDTYLGLRSSYAAADRSWANTLSGAWRSGNVEGLVLYTRRDGSETRNMGSDNSANVNRTAPNPQDIGTDYLLGKLLFRPDGRNTWRLTLESLDRRIDTNAQSAIAVPPLAATSVIGLTAKDSISRDRISLDHQYLNIDHAWLQRAKWNVFYQDASQRQLALEDRNTAADRTRDSRYNQKGWGGGLELESNFKAINAQHRLIYGADIANSRYQGIRDGTVPPVGETFPTKAFPDTDYRTAGAFVQDEVALGQLSLIPGLRYDWYKLSPKTDAQYAGGAVSGQSKGEFSPKLGAVYRLAPAVNVFAQYAHGFRAPTPDQVNNGFQNLVANYRSIANPDLKPETSNSVEAGVRGAGSVGRYSASAFSGRYKDFISQQQISGSFTVGDPGIFQFVNLSNVTISGWEARGEWYVARGFTATGALAYAKGDSNTNGVKAPLDTIDPLKTVLGLKYAAPSSRWGGAVNATHVKAKEGDRVSAATFFKAPAFTIFDLTAFYNVSKNVAINAGLFNLTNQKYWIWSDVRGLADASTVKDAYTQPGRNASVSLRVQF